MSRMTVPSAALMLTGDPEVALCILIGDVPPEVRVVSFQGQQYELLLVTHIGQLRYNDPSRLQGRWKGMGGNRATVFSRTMQQALSSNGHLGDAFLEPIRTSLESLGAWGPSRRPSRKR